MRRDRGPWHWGTWALVWGGLFLVSGATDGTMENPKAPSPSPSAQSAPTAAATAAELELPPDLGTRKQGIDWPSYLGPFGDGKSPETGLALEWPPGGPPVLWQIETGEGHAVPTVARGRLFLFDRHGDRERLTALESETGRELWRAEAPTAFNDYYGYNNGPRASPTVDGPRVYSYGAEGRLRCHKVADGELLWEVDTVEEFGVVQNFFGVASAPVVHGDLLIVAVGGSPPGSPSIHSGEVEGNGTGIVAFDKHTGEVRYTLSDELASYATPRITKIGDRLWGFAFLRGGLLAFHPDTGDEDFFFPWRSTMHLSVNATTPVIHGDEVFITESYTTGGVLLRVKAGGYEVVWKDEHRRTAALAGHWQTPIYHDGYLYGSSGRRATEGVLRCVDWKTGKVRWSEEKLRRVGLLFVDGHFISQSETAQFRVFRAAPEAYTEITRIRLTDEDRKPLLSAPAYGSPVLSHGILYVRGSQELVALDLDPKAVAAQAAAVEAARAAEEAAEAEEEEAAGAASSN